MVLDVEEGLHPESGRMCKVCRMGLAWTSQLMFGFQIVRIAPDGPSTSNRQLETIYLQDDWYETLVQAGMLLLLTSYR